MADISALFGALLAIGIAFPGLLASLWLIFPATVERARLRLDRTPWRCLWLGGVTTAVVSVPIAILLALPFGPAKFAGFALMFTTLAIATLGASGLAAKMADHLARQADGRLSSVSAFVRGAVALELAAAFPILGWFIFTPLAVVVCLGTAAFALLRWMPAAPRLGLPAGETNAVTPRA